jgi:hypothetical protein
MKIVKNFSNINIEQSISKLFEKQVVKYKHKMALKTQRRYLYI